MKDVITVAEIGINHNGSIELAKELIDMAKICGFTYVKFQKRTIGLVYTQEQLDVHRISPWGTTNRQQKYGLEFSNDEYFEIDLYCKQVGIKWFASPWDIKAVKFLEDFNIPFIKVPSALITDKVYLQAVRQTGLPVIISTGMSTRKEVLLAVSILEPKVQYILACTSTYPTANDEMNLAHITTLKRAFPIHRIGFSNHNPGIFYAAVSPVLGAEMVEVHITKDRSLYGSDQASSIEIDGMLLLMRYIRCLPEAMGTGKWVITDGEKIIKEKLRK